MPKLETPPKPSIEKAVAIENSITITRMSAYDKPPKLAFFDAVINGVTVHGLSLVKPEGKAIFVGLPQRKGKDDKWYHVVYIPKGKLADDLLKTAVAHYEAI